MTDSQNSTAKRGPLSEAGWRALQTSGVGTPGTPPGDGAREVDRGTAGAAAPATGSARMVIGFVAMWLASVSFVLWLLFFRERDGLLLLATLFLVVLFWAAGAFTKAFWSR